MNADPDGADIAWQFNEAVSLLRAARREGMPRSLQDEIDEALPEIQSALELAAGRVSSPPPTREEVERCIDDALKAPIEAVHPLPTTGERIVLALIRGGFVVVSDSTETP